MKQNIEKMNKFDIAVIGGGHAGVEAAAACARMGKKTILISMDKKKIGLMSCNPAVGGIAKGQLVREIDALGGIMGMIADRAGIHFKLLNTSKGPAVQSSRAQTDRILYATFVQQFLNKLNNLTILQDTVTDIIIRNNKVQAIILKNVSRIRAEAVILTTGTFLNGLIHIGLNVIPAGRAGELPAIGITECLKSFGFEFGRLKTGTPPRVHKKSINYMRVETQQPDLIPQPFSYSTKAITQSQINCHITYTNLQTHEILKEGFDRSPLFTGRIKGIGPRYCPSIEDKINRFEDKKRHQIFLEPEGYTNDEVYVNGFSTSLPEEIQIKALRTVAGLEKCEILRLGYAIEYDYIPPHQLQNTLETKSIKNLYFAGQINGTSGYEEAAAQGLIAGINAVLKLRNESPFIISRSEAYIGVLIDDLINMIHEEPYRMFTSRAEFRLLLRQDNADLRLMDNGKNFNLINDDTYKKYLNRREEIKKLNEYEIDKKISPDVFLTNFSDRSTPIFQSIMVKDLLKRPEIRLYELLKLISEYEYDYSSIAEVEYNIKYEGYISRQNTLLERFKKYENKLIPEHFDYQKVKSLSIEAREKLIKFNPKSLGQASRISGVSPADLSVLFIYLEKLNLFSVSHETKN